MPVSVRMELMILRSSNIMNNNRLQQPHYRQEQDPHALIHIWILYYFVLVRSADSKQVAPDVLLKRDKSLLFYNIGRVPE